MLWLDGLDVPLIDAMDTIFFELYPGSARNPATQADQASMARFAAPACVRRIFPGIKTIHR